MRRLLAVVFLAYVNACSVAAGQTDRVFDVDDVLDLQAIGDVVVSPAGDRGAFTVVRSLRDCPARKASGRLGYFEHRWRWKGCGEMRVATAVDQFVVASSPERGFFAPRWSPSGEALGFVSLDHRGDAHIWVWRAGQEPVQVTREPIDIEFSAWGARRQEWSPFDWVDDTTIVAATVDRGPFGVKRTPIPHPGEVSEAGWRTQTAGDTPTADQLTTDAARIDLPVVSLIRIDLDTGRATNMASGAFRAMRLSPDGSQAVVSEVIDALRPRANAPMPDVSRYRTPRAASSIAVHTRVGLVDMSKTAPITWFDAVFDMSVSNRPPADHKGRGAGFQPPLPVWSPDGSKLGFIGNSEPKLGASPTLFVLDLASRRVSALDTAGNLIVSLAWVGETLLYAQVQPPADGGGPCTTTWCIAGSRPESAFEHGLIAAGHPKSLQAIGRRDAWFVYGGDVWRLTVPSGTLTNMTKGRFGTVASIEAVDEDADVVTAIVGVRDRGGEGAHVSLSYKDGNVSGRWMDKISGSGLAGSPRMAATGKPDGLILFVSRHSAGLDVWAKRGPGGAPRKLLSLNRHLSGIEQPKTVPLFYAGPNGRKLSAFLALPPDQKRDGPAPLVTWVYPEWTNASAARSFAARVNGRSFLNPHLLPAAGYAVLFPEIPVEPPAEGGPLCRQIADVVVPAVHSAIASGHVHADQIGVFGHSYGGYTAASLMTCTDRFRAGVAVAGFYNLVSYPLSLKQRDRYNGHALGALSGFGEVETVRDAGNRIFQFGDTPWRNLSIYVENSPVFQMPDLSAPLMLIHGELDGVPIEQAENMYVAARRLGKDVSLVRYWGEYHQFYSPANVRDFWKRTISFFDQHLQAH